MSVTSADYQKMTDYLGRLYGCQLFARGGVEHPVTVYYPAESQTDDVDSLLDPWLPRAEEVDFACYDHSYLQDLQNSKPGLYNGRTFTLKRLRQSPLKLRGGIGSYYDMLATCAALEREMRDAAEGGSLRAPSRRAYHRRIAPQDSLQRGDMRSAAIGIGTLTVFNDRGVYKGMLARRSASTAFDSNLFHVLPAMMFGPTTAEFGDPREWSVKHQILREVLEELFGLPEETQPERWDYFYDHPALRCLMQLLEAGSAQLCATGIVLNLLTLRPEISVLLLIHDPAWYDRVSAKDSDMPLLAADETLEGSLAMAPIANDEDFLAHFPPDLHLIMPAQATATMWLCIDRARREIYRTA